MASPTLSHLDPLMLRLMDDVRERLGRVFRAAEGSFAFAVSGTGTSGMETTVANLVGEGTRAIVVVTGYFGDPRYGSGSGSAAVSGRPDELLCGSPAETRE